MQRICRRRLSDWLTGQNQITHFMTTNQNATNPDEIEYPDYETELVQRAMQHAFPHRRGSKSPVTSATTEYFIVHFVREITLLSRVHDRPESHILASATKALNAIHAALTDIENDAF